MKEKLLLVDGHNLLFRAFFGLPNRIPGNEHYSIHGIVGFIGILLKVCNKIMPSHILVVFDCESGSFRNNLNPDYKKNRIQDWAFESENPFTQLPGIYKALDYLSWRYCEIESFEADDVLASYVEYYKKQCDLIMVSTDTDLLQLVNNSVFLYSPKGKKSILFDENAVKEHYGVNPNQIVEFKALVGDKTDNIEGIPGIGPKTAKKLLVEYGTLNRLFDCFEKLPNNLRSKLDLYRERIFKNKDLITLYNEVVLPFNLEELRISEGSLNKKTMQILKDIEII